MTSPVTVVVLAKAPVAGLVKTRLTPPYPPAQAARLAAAALSDTLAAVRATPRVRPVLCLSGADSTAGAQLQQAARRTGCVVLPQRGVGLAERLAAAFEDADQGGPVVLVGMDTPQLTPLLLCAAAAALDDADAVLGRAHDGGWWLLGLRRPDARLFAGVEMSTSRTGAQQLARLRAAGLRVALAPRLRDVDTAADAAAVAGLAPGTRFAAQLRALRPHRPSAAAASS